MFMHTDQAWNHGVAGEIHAVGSGGNVDAGGAADCRDLSVVDDDGLVLGGRCSGAVHHAHVQQRDDRIVHAHEGLRAGLETILGLRTESATRKHDRNENAHVVCPSIQACAASSGASTPRRSRCLPAIYRALPGTNEYRWLQVHCSRKPVFAREEADRYVCNADAECGRSHPLELSLGAGLFGARRLSRRQLYWILVLLSCEHRAECIE
jgi:hypothetical protein